MIKQVSHTVTGADPAGLALALEVAYALHAPTARAPEVAPVGPVATRPTARRTAAARTRRRTVRG